MLCNCRSSSENTTIQKLPRSASVQRTRDLQPCQCGSTKRALMSKLAAIVCMSLASDQEILLLESRNAEEEAWQRNLLEMHIEVRQASSASQSSSSEELASGSIFIISGGLAVQRELISIQSAASSQSRGHAYNPWICRSSSRGDRRSPRCRCMIPATKIEKQCPFVVGMHGCIHT